MELRTLKDFEPDDMARKGQIDFGVSARELKAEAVKWVKFHQTRSDVTITDFLNGWIKHFFNLTEEELTEVEG